MPSTTYPRPLFPFPTQTPFYDLGSQPPCTVYLFPLNPRLLYVAPLLTGWDATAPTPHDMPALPVDCLDQFLPHYCIIQPASLPFAMPVRPSAQAYTSVTDPALPFPTPAPLDPFLFQAWPQELCLPGQWLPCQPVQDWDAHACTEVPARGNAPSCDWQHLPSHPQTILIIPSHPGCHTAWPRTYTNCPGRRHFPTFRTNPSLPQAAPADPHAHPACPPAVQGTSQAACPGVGGRDWLDRDWLLPTAPMPSYLVFPLVLAPCVVACVGSPLTPFVPAFYPLCHDPSLGL